MDKSFMSLDKTTII